MNGSSLEEFSDPVLWHEAVKGDVRQRRRYGARLLVDRLFARRRCAHQVKCQVRERRRHLEEHLRALQGPHVCNPQRVDVTLLKDGAPARGLDDGTYDSTLQAEVAGERALLRVRLY